MDLSVVVVNWKGGHHLASLLESLRPLADELYETLVIDNASGEEEPRVLAELPRSRWIASSENLGFAGGTNLAADLVAAPFFLLLNPDVQLTAGSVRGLYQAMRNLRRAAVVCGPLVGEDGRPQSFQLRPLPTPGNVLRECLLGRAAGPDPPSGEAPLAVEQPAAACWLVRKEAWLEVGGMDPRFHPAWFEDVDFCLRVRQAGWKLYYLPNCPIRHQGAASLESLGRTRFLSIYYGNLLRYLRKHHPRAAPWLWLPVQLGKLARMAGLGRLRRSG